MYSHCALHGLAEYNTVVRNSRNIRIYGVMDESDYSGYLRAENSANILIAGIGTHLGRDQPRASFRFEHCSDIVVAVLNGKDGLGWTRVQDDKGVKISGAHHVSYYGTGSPEF